MNKKVFKFPARVKSDDFIREAGNIPLEIKIGQFICAGITGTSLDENFRETINQYPFGNFGLFDCNISTPKQVATLNKEIQKIVMEATGGIECMIAIDEEGGASSQFAAGLTKTPGNFALGATSDPNIAFECGKLIGGELFDMGINVAWSPVLDLCAHRSEHIIGIRSFGKSPLLASQLGVAFSKGLNAGGVVSTYKHFPGYGESVVSADTGVLINSHSEEHLLENGAYPFKTAILEGADAIAMGHIAFPSITEDFLPAPLSKKITTNILRDTLGYDGVIMTELPKTDLYTLKKVGTLAFEAGCDMIIHCSSRHHQILIYNALLSMARNGKIKEERINRSAARILAMKKNAENYRNNRVAFPSIAKSEIVKNFCNKSITLLRDNNGLIPLNPAKYRNLLVIEPIPISISFVDGSDEMECSLGSHISIEGYNVTVVKSTLNTTQTEIANIVELSQTCDAIIVGSIDSNEFTCYLQLIQVLSKLKPLIVVSLRFPYEADIIPEHVTMIGAFSVIDSSMDAVARVISGKLIPTGINPVYSS